MINSALRQLRAAWQFMLDVKIGADLGESWPSAVSFAWKIWGWQGERSEITRRVDRVIG